MPREVRIPRVIVRLETVNCASCGITFGVPDHLIASRRKDGESFKCPNGHGNVYNATTVESLNAEIKKLTAERDTLKGQVLQLKHKLEQAGIP